MPAKLVLLHEKAREGILAGVNLLADAAQVTLGPRGRNVMIQRSWGAPTVTKDGGTVVKEIDREDKFENVGARMVREVAQKTSDVAGDGTTTATVLARAIFREGLRLLAAGFDAMELKRGIDAAVQKAVEALKAQAKPVKERERIAQVGTVSANGDAAIGELFAEAMDKVGQDGVITVEEAKGLDTTLEVVEGMRFDRGYLSPYFVTNPDKMTVELEDPLLLFFEKKISSMRDLLPLRERVAQAGKPIAIIAEEVAGGALGTLAVNKLPGTVRCAAAKAPSFVDRPKALVEDAMHATRAAVEEGIVPGGGVALLRAQKALEGLKFEGERAQGVAVVQAAMEEPLRQIAANAGHEPAVVLAHVRAGKDDLGFNAVTETYEPLLKAGVIDPAKVVRTALQNAASVAGLLLTTEDAAKRAESAASRVEAAAQRAEAAAEKAERAFGRSTRK